MNLNELIAYHERQVAHWDERWKNAAEIVKDSSFLTSSHVRLDALQNRRFHTEASDLLRCMVRAQGGGTRWGR